jgi:hypothetical protein
VVIATPKPLYTRNTVPNALYGWLSGSQDRSGRRWGREKSLAPPGFAPHSVQRIASRYTDS